jgi:pyrimidine operon attenuation protein/uracil phosphoribosyltransferase
MTDLDGMLYRQEEIARAIELIGGRLCELIQNPRQAAFIGIYTHGVPLARRLKQYVDQHLGTITEIGTLDINLYRDDYDLRGVKPRIQSSDIHFSIDERELILVDDVLFTGRTIRSAIEALGDYGRPSAIRLAVLADRGHRELPIQADAVGITIPTELKDRVRVSMSEIDGKDEISLLRGGLK